MRGVAKKKKKRERGKKEIRPLCPPWGPGDFGRDGDRTLGRRISGPQRTSGGPLPHCFPITVSKYWLGWGVCLVPGVRLHSIGARLIYESQRSKESQLVRDKKPKDAYIQEKGG